MYNNVLSAVAQMLATRPGHQPGYRVALSAGPSYAGGRGRGGTDCVGNLHTPK